MTPWLPWRNGSLAYDYRTDPVPVSVPKTAPPTRGPIVIVAADCYQRRDEKWAWSAEVAPLVVDGAELGGESFSEGDDTLIPGRPARSGGLCADEATARGECEAWILAAVERVAGHVRR